jgi:cellulose synthase/poly-beta-1,6-N-acetylglucosamine synthase-like glycosyltransferase
MFLIDNRIQNLGRTNLGWSAKNMGDSICFRADVLRQLKWSDGLADDYQLRQKFLFNGVKIAYERAAIGYGEAPLTWGQAKAQRTRWIRGVQDANRQFSRQLFFNGIKTKNAAMLDGALQALLPSYSALTAIAASLLLLHLIAIYLFHFAIPSVLIAGWASVVVVLFFYPIMGLLLERAPAKAYLMILTGPVFIVWRLWLSFIGRSRRNITWVRTAHKG